MQCPIDYHKFCILQHLSYQGNILANNMKDNNELVQAGES